MQERHLDRKRYFHEQSITTDKYVIPYIESVRPIDKNTRVLEIGCGEGGNILPFLKRGCSVVGVDLNERQINNARAFIEESLPNADVQFILKDIYKVNLEELKRFDLIIMRDVIEHIHNQEKFLAFLKSLLKPNGLIFFGFPPWRMPFGGHQQICKSKVLSKLPFFHIFPSPIYALILKMFGEKATTIESLLEIKETGISIRRFENIIHSEKYSFEKKDYYFINPNYEIKFGLKPRKTWKILAALPHIKDSFITCYYCIIKKPEEG